MGDSASAVTNFNDTPKSCFLVDVNGNKISWNSNGQNIMANSSPVVIASDQTPIPIKRSTSTIYTTTQTGISATGNSGDLAVGQYTELLVLFNLTAIAAGTATFRIRAKDAFTNYYTISTSTAQSAPTALTIYAGAGLNSTSFGDTVIIEWQLATASGVNFQLSVKAK